jgi:hypothetical protein
MIPYFPRLLDITMNNRAIPGDWKKTIVVPIYKKGNRSVIGNYRPASLTSVVCKQREHVTTGQLRQMCEKIEWLYESQHGFRPGYSYENQLLTICQDISDDLDEGVRKDWLEDGGIQVRFPAGARNFCLLHSVLHIMYRMLYPGSKAPGVRS